MKLFIAFTLVLLFQPKIFSKQNINEDSKLEIEFTQNTVKDFESEIPMKIIFDSHPNDRYWFDFLRTLYNKNNLNMIIPGCLRIPKIVHQIWLGSPFPEELKTFALSWKIIHPDWIYILWTDSDIPKLNLLNQKQYNQAKNFGQKADILRYEILYQFGGLYIDTDFYCLKRFDILHDCYDFYAGLGVADVSILNGLIGSAPGHPILKHIIDYIGSLNQIQLQDILNSTGPYQFTRSFMAIAPSYNGSVIIFPHSFFYPSPNNERFQSIETQNRYIKRNSFAIHYWKCSWQRRNAFID